jgi:hypothetical protein
MLKDDFCQVNREGITHVVVSTVIGSVIGAFLTLLFIKDSFISSACG